MNRQDLGHIEMDSTLAITLDRLENEDGIDFVLTRHGSSIRFWVTRLHGYYYVASVPCAPGMIGIDPQYPGERFENDGQAWTEIDSQLDK